MKTWIGTSGFQYAEWKGSFYPEDLSTAKMLPYFAERLSTTEINYTFHRIPSPKTIDNWLAQTPENFRFALKAPQKITHFAKLRDCQDTIAYFYRVVSALGDRLGPVLFQLPPNFKKNADVLSAFLRELPAMRAALNSATNRGLTTRFSKSCARTRSPSAWPTRKSCPRRRR